MQNVSDKSKIIYLVILALFILTAGFFWLDYIGMVNLGKTFQNYFAGEPESVVDALDDEPSLIEKEEFEKEFAGPPKKAITQIILQIGLILGGLLLLTVGAKWLVDGSVTIARILGMSELLIGLTIIAVGTSLPEVAASILASIKGERDIAVGNVIGSNIFNVMCVMGLSGAISPDGVEVSQTALRLDIPVMIVVALACLPIFFTTSTLQPRIICMFALF